MKARILGSGTSSGVPRIGNDWGACDPAEPRNRRTRASLLVEHENTRILIDSSPDMRAQLLDANVENIDAVIWTHEHADHVFGIDDLRQLFHIRGRPIPGYARSATRAGLEARFGYVFHGHDGYPPIVTLAELPDTLTIGGVSIGAADQPHGSITSAGLRFDAGTGAIGYATDISAMTDELRTLYQGLEVWIIDALRRRPHPTHLHLDRALEWIAELSPKRAALIHMDQSMDYRTLLAELPDEVEPGYDGLEFVI